MSISLRLIAGRFAVCRLDAGDEIPSWARGEFVSVTTTSEELSIVCSEEAVPASIRSERGWRCLKVAGPIPFETTGIAASIASPLAHAGISLFLVSTFDTDYVLVKEPALASAIAALRASGCNVSET